MTTTTMHPDDMPNVALLVPPRSRALVGYKVRGKQLEEWSAMALARYGVGRLLVASRETLEEAGVARLRGLGLRVEITQQEFGSLSGPLLIISGDVIIRRLAIEALAARVATLGLAAAAAAEAAPGIFALLTPPAVAGLPGLEGGAFSAALDAMRVCHISDEFTCVPTNRPGAQNLVNRFTGSHLSQRVREVAQMVFRMPAADDSHLRWSPSRLEYRP